MLSSGETAIATTDDNAVDVIANASGEIAHEVTVINEGAVAGFVSIDNGKTWLRLPAGPASLTFDLRERPFAPVIQVKRKSGGSDLSDVYAYAL